MNIFLNEYFGFCFELNHFQAKFNEKINFQNVSPRAIYGAVLSSSLNLFYKCIFFINVFWLPFCVQSTTGLNPSCMFLSHHLASLIQLVLSFCLLHFFILTFWFPASATSLPKVILKYVTKYSNYQQLSIICQSLSKL